MKMMTKLKLAGAAMFVFSVLAGGWLIVGIGIVILGAWMAIKMRGKGGESQHSETAKMLAKLLLVAPINFAALVASKRWGIYAILGVVALMLIDLSFGSDGLSFPLIGWFGIFVIAVFIGGYDWHKRKAPLFEQVEDMVRAVVPGYTVTRPPEIVYGSGPLRGTLGKFQPLDTFSFRVPGEVDSTDIENIEIRLRQRLPAALGSTWGFNWDLRRSYCVTNVIPDLPRSLWHPYTDGSFGTPLAPVGDPFKIPLGVTFGGEVIYWEPDESPHMFVVGASGGGKSVLILDIMEHMLLFREHWDLYLIDLKRTELTEWGRYDGAVKAVATGYADSLEVLTLVFNEMDHRQDLLDMYSVQDLKRLNEAMVSRGEQPLKHVCVIMDEVGRLLAPITGTSDEMKTRKEIRDACELKMSDIAALGRAMGVHLLYATQRTSKDIVPMDVRMNTQCRLGLGNLDTSQSQMVFESDIANKMRGGKGRGIAYENGELKEIQTYRIDKSNIREMLGVTPEEAAKI